MTRERKKEEEGGRDERLWKSMKRCSIQRQKESGGSYVILCGPSQGDQQPSKCMGAGMR